MIKPPLLTLCSLLGILALDPVYAGQIPSTSVPHSVQGIAEREISRRNDQIARAQQAIAEGDKAMRVKDYEVAVQQYKSAADVLTESPVTHKLRSVAVDRYCDASVQLAQQRIAEGRYAEAEAAAKAVLADAYNPKCGAALTLLAHLEEPGYYNKTITPKFHANVEQVKAWFVDAQGYYDTGRYEQAMKRYDQILGIDPTNSAAREGQVKVTLARSEYAAKAYDEARSRQLWKVTQSWESPVRKYGLKSNTVISSAQGPSSTAAIQNKLNSIIIPKVEFHDATVREAIDFLKRKSAELDVRETDPSRRGVNIVLQLDVPSGTPTAAPAVPGLDPAAAPAAGGAAAASGINPAEARITLSLNNMPLAEVLRYITTLAGLKVKIDQYAVAIVPITVVTDQLITKEYKVPPGAFQNAVNGGSAAPAAAPSARGGGAPSGMIPQGGPIGQRILAKDYFSGQGVIDVIVEALNGTVPLQVAIEAKFVEITQTNLKELSFDWSMGGFNIPGSDKLFGFGGTSGTTSITAGNRTGVGSNAAISANAIDSLLYPSSNGATPGVFTMAGVYTDPQFQVIIRALNEKKGVDLLSSPSVTTKSGQRATIEIVREFKYPTEYNPPQVPSSSGSGAGSVITVTPTTPTAFEVRNTGVSLEVEPVVGPDGSTIDLNLSPMVTEFEGFINYGTPIYASNGTTTSKDPLTLNVINQPIFSTRKVQTSVSVWDGQTVMLGGLIREDVQKVEDKVPFLGDLPGVGRLFRSSVDQHQKRNLVIFVTAKLINPAGDPINSVDEEKDDAAELPGAGVGTSSIAPAALGAPEAESLMPTK
jgi:general secretion pathway protein D